MTDLDAEFDAFATAHYRRPGPICTACSMGSAWRKKVTTWRKTQQLSLIARFLKAKGVNVSSYTLARHFREGHEG